jgi:hypothetical protein
MSVNAKYDNCKIYAPNDKLLGYCDKRKYDWYIKKGLVDVIGDDLDKSIRLKFEPKNNNINGQFQEYCKIEIETQCVVCGSKEFLNKFHVVPLEFRRFFPLHMKSHASHDVVLVCADCQSDLNYMYHQYKTHLLEKFKLVPNPNLVKIKSSADKHLRLLKKYNQDIHSQYSQYNTHKQQLDQNEIILKELLGHDVTIEELEQLKDICTYDNLGTAKSIGEYIVNQYKDNLQEFEKNWRKVFVDSIEPKFLPNGW